MPKYSIVVVDDHPLLREALCRNLAQRSDFEVIGEAGDGEEAVKVALELKPDLVIMDVGLPKLSGVEATKRIKAACPEIALLVLTIHDDEEYILSLLEAGAAGYLLKTSHSEDIDRAISAVLTGEMVLDPSVCGKLVRMASSRTQNRTPVEITETLSTREMEVLRLAAKGLANKSIACEYNLLFKSN